jgi:hypothetical protein
VQHLLVVYTLCVGPEWQATLEQVVLKAVPNVPIYYTTDNTSALTQAAFLADTALTYDAAKGIAIPAGCDTPAPLTRWHKPGLPERP